MVEFVGTCVAFTLAELQAYDETERDITYRTFAKHVGPEVIREINCGEGIGCARYDYEPGRAGLTLKQDWHVTFGKGKWKGKPAVGMHHSSIHHIWIIT